MISDLPHLADYLTHLAAAGRSRGTIRLRRHYLEALRRNVSDLMAANPRDLRAFLANESWSPETRRSAVATVRGFYQWALTEQLIQVDPSRNLPRVSVPAGVPRPAPEDVVRTARRQATPRVRLMIDLAMYEGLRRSEIATLRVENVQDGALFITGKGGKVRRIPLRPSVSEALREAIGPREHGYVFPGAQDGHASPNWVGKLLARALGPGRTGHQLRHAAATRWYKATGDLLTVQQLLGHSRPETTARYVQVPDDALRRAVES